MIDWLTSFILQAAAWLSGLFFSKDAPNFSVIAGMTAIVLVVGERYRSPGSSIPVALAVLRLTMNG